MATDGIPNIRGLVSKIIIKKKTIHQWSKMVLLLVDLDMSNSIEPKGQIHQERQLISFNFSNVF